MTASLPPRWSFEPASTSNPRAPVGRFTVVVDEHTTAAAPLWRNGKSFRFGAWTLFVDVGEGCTLQSDSALDPNLLEQLASAGPHAVAVVVGDLRSSPAGVPF